MGVTVLGGQDVGFILVLVHHYWRGALHVAEPGMLEKMAAEGVPGFRGSLIPGGYP